MSTELDGMTDTAAIIELERQFSEWMCYRGTDRLCYATLRYSDSMRLVRGEDWTDLRDQIRGHIGRHAES